jgi:transcriptional regulator with GAF, ATPase, and Fis domain
MPRASTSSKPIEPSRAQIIARRPEWASRYGSIIGASPKLQRVFHIIDRVAPSDGTVLICGESGTGKELVAEAIHRNSPRAKGPFVKLNCAALVESLLLSELFGHERGSFTGAHQRKIGRFEMAAGGTIFLDEIGDISPKTQVSLLRVLQEREFERVGGGRPIKVEARIIVATNRNLAAMVRDGTFREDLYYRLKGLTIDLPPLRERPEDVIELASHFLNQYAAESGVRAKILSTGAMDLLLGYAWPGNIRELENIIRSVALFAESSTIEARDFDEYRELFQDGPVWQEANNGRAGRDLSTVLDLGLPAGPPRQGKSTQGSGPSWPAQVRETADVPPPMKARHTTPPEAHTFPQLDDDDEDSAPFAPFNGENPGSTQQVSADLEGDLLSQIFAQGVPLPELKKRIQEQAIARALRMTKGNITRAAEVLGMRRPRLSQIINASEELKGLCQGVER